MYTCVCMYIEIGEGDLQYSSCHSTCFTGFSLFLSFSPLFSLCQCICVERQTWMSRVLISQSSVRWISCGGGDPLPLHHWWQWEWERKREAFCNSDEGQDLTLPCSYCWAFQKREKIRLEENSVRDLWAQSCTFACATQWWLGGAMDTTSNSWSRRLDSNTWTWNLLVASQTVVK